MMGNRFRLNEIAYTIIDTAVHQGTDPVRDLPVVRLHPLRDPVQHHAHEAVLVEFRNESFVRLGQSGDRKSVV